MSDLPDKELTRRGFLTRVGGGIIATNVAGTLLDRPALAQQVPDPPGKKLGWAIVGLGSLAINQILPAFSKCEKSKVVALVSGHPDKANKLALRYNVNPKNIYNYQNYDTLKDNPEVDIIYIVLPNSMHAEYTIRGAQAGKHVLSEKPMATSPADCQSMIDAAQKSQSQAHGRVSLPLRALQSGNDPYGALQRIWAIKVIIADHGFNIGDPSQWRLKRELSGGGCLMDIGIYSLQAARYITGEEPTEVTAQTYTDTERSALQGSRRNHQLPAAFPERRPRQLHLELRLQQSESLSRGLLRRMV